MSHSPLPLPSTTRTYRRTAPPYPLTIVPSTEPLPQSLDPHSLLLRIHAVSLNYRDIAMLQENGYPVPVLAGGIPASDCAAEVVAVGEKVSKFQVGDRVAPTFDLACLTGEERGLEMRALGGEVEGVLREWVVLEEEVLVRLPGGVSWEEASTIACAGVTAWSALGGLRDVRKDAVALLQGTGGVSMFALLLCLAAGIKPIITSSSDEKLQKLKELGDDVLTINYKTTPDVAAEALRLTDGQGVDFVVNNVGLSSLPEDMKMLRKYGRIALIGFLGGLEARFDASELMTLLFKRASIQGIGVGSRKDFEDLNRFLEERKVELGSIVDRVFEFEDAPEAFEYLASGKHKGKVVVKV
ncbi:NAD(P)-binding protein [Westerdykella ornata]|uniref:NAD(P)-binding protein n=1 Tax=Westerdykella ornata TaxID=318751 RepID=A0A6A6J606_WESOR|nr:NAD(P)-binding protein [Westerdykella ornata]KAF2272011.1 NAD(P)-binding protein [Westerdykella ornata]